MGAQVILAPHHLVSLGRFLESLTELVGEHGVTLNPYTDLKVSVNDGNPVTVTWNDANEQFEVDEWVGR